MKKSAKLLSVLIGLGLTFSLTACGDFYFGSGARSNVPPSYEASETEDEESGSVTTGGEEDGNEGSGENEGENDGTSTENPNTGDGGDDGGDDGDGDGDDGDGNDGDNGGDTD